MTRSLTTTIIFANMSTSNIEIPQPFLQALQHALVEQLGLTLSNTQQALSNAPRETPAFAVLVKELATKLLGKKFSAGASPVSIISPRTPVRTGTPVDDKGTPVSRTSSSVDDNKGTPVSRTSSSCSSSSSASDRSFGNDDDVVFIRKRKSTPERDAADTKVVTVPILRHFDSKWLALHPNSTNNPMFEFKVRSGFGYVDESSRPRKKFQDMVMPFFKRESRAIIRRLVTDNLRAAQEVDPSITYEELRKRYEKAALRVVRKRRANHVQSWRPDKNGRPKPLIYGGADPTVLPTRQKSDVVNGKPKQESVVVNDKPKQEPVVVDTPKQESVVVDGKPKSGVEFLVANNNDSGSETEDETPLFCSECKKHLTPISAFPKERWGSDDSVWCAGCWRVEQNKLVCKHVKNVQKRKAKLREIGKLGEDKDKKGAPPRKRQKKNKDGKMCKWCGSTTHFRRSSLQCPHNKKNKKKKKVVITETEDESKDRDKHEESDFIFITETEDEGEDSGEHEESDYAVITETEEEGEGSNEYEDSDYDNESDGEYEPKVGAKTKEPEVATKPTAAQPTATVGAGPVTPTNPPMLWYRHDVVIAKFKRKQWFLAHVTATRPNNRYDVYFLGDGKVRKGDNSLSVTLYCMRAA